MILEVGVVSDNLQVVPVPDGVMSHLIVAGWPEVTELAEEVKELIDGEEVTVFVCGATVTSAYLYTIPETTPAEFLLTQAMP